MDTQLTVRIRTETDLLLQEKLQGSTVGNACTTEAWHCLTQQELNEPSQRVVNQHVRFWDNTLVNSFLGKCCQPTCDPGA